jgi:hypothetical protein
MQFLKQVLVNIKGIYYIQNIKFILVSCISFRKSYLNFKQNYNQICIGKLIYALCEWSKNKKNKEAILYIKVLCEISTLYYY